MKKTLPIYTVLHFLVDLTCIFKLFSTVRPQADNYENWVVLVVLYNFLAFALPAFEGLAADLIDSDLLVAAAGCALVGTGAVFSYPVLAIVILIGIGNGLFHIGAGRRVLVCAKGAYSPPGIFISSGALGVFLGMSWARQFYHPLDYLFAGLMFVAAVLLVLLAYRESRAKICEKSKISNEEFSVSQKNGYKLPSGSLQTSARLLTPAACMILAVVILRSFYGSAVYYSWKDTFLVSLIFTICIAGGKAAGGIAADRIGVRNASILSLAGAAITVLFSVEVPVVGCVSILLFNMTMPLTLTLLSELWKPYPGMAFGVLMMGLFLGTLPDTLLGGAKLTVAWLCIICLISLALLLLAIRAGRQKTINNERHK